MAKRTQKDRSVGIGTPLGEDVLLLRAMDGTEELSELFRYDLDLLSEAEVVNPAEIVGKNVTVRLDLGENQTRCFNGIVSRFVHVGADAGLTQYLATVVPWLWLLTKRADCRIFQEMTVPDIIKKVFRDLGLTDFEDRLSGQYRTWEYCVQYRETDFNFVSRLMEQEGITYFFEHEDAKHTLVLVDSISAYQPFPGYEEIKYRPPSEGRTEGEYITEWTVETRVQSASYALDDFDFKKPKKDLLAVSNISRDDGAPKFEVYDYPGEYVETGDGDTYARARIEELHARYEMATACTEARGACVGRTFTLAEHPRDGENGEYLIIGAAFHLQSDEFGSGDEGSGGPLFACTCTALDINQPFRPPRLTPKPVVHGVQTAMVVGKSGEEIWTDEYGRVKVQFHWDRYGKNDENSSCWIRVAQPTSGRNWGWIVIPRIGQEVVVEFLEGDPDRPLITGEVYNGDCMPPYELPANATRSTMKSNSSKGGDGFNEIRFEDKKDHEQIFIRGQRDIDTRTLLDAREWIGNERHLIVGDDEEGTGNQHELIRGQKHLCVKADHIEKVEGNMALTVGKGEGSGGAVDIVIEKDKKELIEAASHLHVKSDRNEKVDGKLSRTVGTSQEEKVGEKHAVDAGQEIHLKGGMKVIVEAGMQLTIKGPGGFVDIGPSGVTIQGTMVMINSGGSAGSGSGASPTAPQDAQEAQPTEPAEADEDQTGHSCA